jgi:CheY-like chemotaxis protein
MRDHLDEVQRLWPTVRDLYTVLVVDDDILVLDVLAKILAQLGIFATGKTGVSLAPLVAAARAFLASLSAPQRQAAASFAIGDDAWRRWSNMHPWVMRHGVCLADLGHDQREAALGLMRESLSAAGYQLARDIMRLNEHALEITDKPEEYSEWFYWISFFGTPSLEDPWGLPTTAIISTSTPLCSATSSS